MLSIFISDLGIYLRDDLIFGDLIGSFKQAKFEYANDTEGALKGF